MPEYDIILYGATGFTGELSLTYLLKHPAIATVKFAVAGRSQTKLEQVIIKCGGKVEDIPIIVANCDDEAQLTSMVKQTKVIISFVGPYEIYGHLLVQVCAENGTHYIDLCGESQFSYKVMKKNEAAALCTKAIIISACGFDCVPASLTVAMAVQRLAEIEGVKVGKVTSLFSMKGSIS